MRGGGGRRDRGPRAARAALLTCALLALGALPAGPAVASAPVTSAPVMSAPVTAAAPSTDARIAELVARVDAFTREYRRRSAESAAVAAELAQAYTTIAATDDGAQAAEDQVAAGRAELADRARAVYALGSAAHGRLALLTADSTVDALWQLSIDGPLAERLLDSTTRATADAERLAAVARRRAEDASAAADQVGALLTRLRTAQDAAAWAHDVAAGELTRLRAVAHAEELARLAAERLEAARREADAVRVTGPVGALDIPPAFAQGYHDAARTCPGLDWTLLAAVGQVESGHGRNDGPSSAGAIGPMQFMPATFAAYAVDGDGDGVTDPWNAPDAIFTAARYLCTSGAGTGPDGVRTALFAYNHAQWYVDLVLAAQSSIAVRYPG